MNSAVPDRRISGCHLWDGLSRSPIPVRSEPAPGSLRLLRVGRSVGDDPLELADRLVLQVEPGGADGEVIVKEQDRKSTRLNSSHGYISYAVFCLKKKKKQRNYIT